MFKILDIKEEVISMHQKGHLAHEICRKFNISLYTLYERILKPNSKLISDNRKK